VLALAASLVWAPGSSVPAIEPESVSLGWIG
jgi:hypothetical protein